MHAEEKDAALRNTRRSLVERLGNPDDHASWQAFFEGYGGLLYRVARAAGLTDSEAQDAVQETVITVARNVGGLRYAPAVGSFKSWPRVGPRRGSRGNSASISRRCTWPSTG